MAIYVIADAEINDPEKYKAYLENAPKFVQKHGGEYLVRGGDFEVLVGDWKPSRLLVFKWPNREALDNFMNDPGYQPWKELRESVTTRKNLLIVEGVKEPVF